MGDWFVRCWVAGMLLLAAAVHCAEERKAKDHFCIVDDERSPGVCRPLEQCDAAPVLQHYADVSKQCLTSSSQRRARRESFLNQMKHSHGELRFLFDQLEESHNVTSGMITEIESSSKAYESALGELERKCFYYSIQAGQTKDALLAYLVMPTQPSPTEIIAAVSAESTFNEAVLLNLLFFARSVPSKALRLELYKAIKPTLYANKKLNSYMLLLYSAEVFPVVRQTADFQEYYTDVITPFVKRLKDFVFRDDYIEFIWLANRFPSYFAHAIPLLTQFSSTEWTTQVKHLPLFDQVNSLRSLSSQLTLFERMIANIVQHDISGGRTDRSGKLLPSLANQVSKLQKALEAAGSDPKLMKRLAALKKSFKMHKSRPKLDYEAYLHHFKNFGKMKPRT